MIKDLNIIIPLKNEDEQVEITVQLLINELKDLKKNFFITLIDDYSNDTTWHLLNKIKEKYKNIQIYQNKYGSSGGSRHSYNTPGHGTNWGTNFQTRKGNK